MTDEHVLILLLALLLDRLIGDPAWLWSQAPHPIVVFGKAISFLDRKLNLKRLTASMRRRNGVVAIVILLVAALLAGSALHALLSVFGWLGIMIEALLVAIFLAQKSLADHVNEVAKALRSDGLSGGRLAVSRIVGRDPETLDEAGVCRAAIESLAENFSDGVVAPALWYAVLGLPGLFMYKMLNTADSMIGHKSETYIDFGWAAARLDDIANWPAARLSVLLIAVGALAKSGDGGRTRYPTRWSEGLWWRDRSRAHDQWGRAECRYRQRYRCGCLDLLFRLLNACAGDIRRFSCSAVTTNEDN
jgi:adenosylcobinamide-phosphate synthase